MNEIDYLLINSYHKITMDSNKLILFLIVYSSVNTETLVEVWGSNDYGLPFFNFWMTYLFISLFLDTIRYYHGGLQKSKKRE